MKIAIASCLIAAVLSAALADAQAPDPNEIMKQLGPGPAQMLESVQALQEKYARIEEDRKAERKAMSEKVAAEERDRAMANAAALAGQNVDPMSAAEVNTRKRLEPLHEQWKAEDAALELEKQADMEKLMAESGLLAPMPPR
jgi:Spy/CpxP family protein refolding chaperone